MRRWVPIALAVAACVPSATDENPAGGIALTLAPSAATKGAPFVTQDGWTVAIDRFALRAQANDVTQSGGGGPGPMRVLFPGPSCELRISGAAAGVQAKVTVSLGQRPVGDSFDTQLGPCGVDAAMAARFEVVADNADPFFGAVLPNLVLHANAEKNGRHVTIDLVVSVETFSDPTTAPTVTIIANAGVPETLPVLAERLLDPADPFALKLDDMLAADTNGDGILTGKEMTDFLLPCDSSNPNEGGGGFIGAGDDGGIAGVGDTSDSSGSGDDDSTSAAPTCPTLLDVMSQKNLPGMFGQVTSP